MNRQEAVAIMPRRQRCAIYTRKSSEEGLTQEFNSLDAQREACEAFVTSQKSGTRCIASCRRARAWDWRRQLERGEAATLKDIADAERVTVPYISRLIRLAFLAPAVLEGLLIHRRPCAVSIDKLCAAALVPWAEQVDMEFGE